MSSKSKIFWSLFVILVMVLGTTTVLADVVSIPVNYIMSIGASYNGKKLAYEEEIVIENSDTNRTITVTTDAQYVDSSLTIYRTLGKGTRQAISTGKKSTTWEIPNNLEEGKSYWLGLEAVSNNTTDNYIGNSNIFYVKITCPKTTIDANLKNGSKTLSAGSTTVLESGTTLTVVGTSNKGVKAVCYQWGGESSKTVTGSSTTVTVPNGNPDQEFTLKITAQSENGKWLNPAKEYTIKLPSKTEEPLELSVDLYNNNKVVSDGSTIELESGKQLVIKGSSNKTVKKVSYKWDSNAQVEVEGTQTTITVPSGSSEQKFSLAITAMADGKWAQVKKYTIKLPKVTVTPEPEPEPQPQPEGETRIGVVLKNGSTTLTENTTIELKSGTELTIEASSNRTVLHVSYVLNGGTQVDLSGSKGTFKVPEGSSEQKFTLAISAETDNNKWAKKKEYTIQLPKSEVTPEPEPEPEPQPQPVEEKTTISTTLKDGSTVIDKNSVINKQAGDTLVIEASSNKGIKQICYKWGNGDLIYAAGDKATITVPSGANGSQVVLAITAESNNSKWAQKKEYTIKYPDKQALTGTITASTPFGNLGETEDKSTSLNVDEKVTVKVDPKDNFSKVEYNWDDGAFKDVPSDRIIKIPTDFKPGTTHKLTIKGTLKDGGVVTKVYYIKIPALTDNELDIDPWMRENDDAEGLIIALRNTSDTKKDNYNFYMLNEEIIYLIDYKNAGKDIDQEVKVEFKLPLEFDVVDADGGTVDKDKKTITWVYSGGLEKGFASTKRVIIKYTAFARKSIKSEIVYPQAIIYKANKKQDVSSVVNYIYEDEDTVLDTVHNPYMYGDHDAPTFRPDDGISRAEGALVLLRIFEVDYSGVKNITTKYSDVGETYLEAQKAITKATELGLINGYTDGTYRPNEKMTRAEFMKIIAVHVEQIAHVDGLQIKDNTAVTVYKHGKNKTHWAVPYVTLLCRLNLTSASSSEKDLRIDDTITRAEVAQLCNYVLLRAPAKITTKVSIDFMDVSKSHKLVGDIVEATRAKHEFTVTDDGKEIAK